MQKEPRTILFWTAASELYSLLSALSLSLSLWCSNDLKLQILPFSKNEVTPRVWIFKRHCLWGSENIPKLWKVWRLLKGHVFAFLGEVVFPYLGIYSTQPCSQQLAADQLNRQGPTSLSHKSNTDWLFCGSQLHCHHSNAARFVFFAAFNKIWPKLKVSLTEL